MVPPSDPRLWTAEDLLRPGAPRASELWDGALLVREPSGGPAVLVGTRILGALLAYLGRHPLGTALMSDQGFWVARDPDRVLSPDVAFVRSERLPAVPRRGFIPFAPCLAVEVRSPSDTWIDVVEKGGIWIAHGSRVVWAVDPETRTVVVLRPAEPARAFHAGEAADAEPLLPGFRVRLEDLFCGL